MNIVVANRQRTRKIKSRLLKAITEALLADLKIADAEIGINLVAAREMTSINKTFLRHEGSTDVITFDHSAPETRDHLHGELFVCVDEAVLQAKRFKTTWQSEIVRCVVHGILHLLGHDDHQAAARRRMKREENRRLRELSRRFALSKLGGDSRLAAWNRKACSRAGAPIS